MPEQDDKKTFTPWGMNAPGDASFMKMLFEKLEEVQREQAEISKNLAVHVQSENQWQKSVEGKIDNHVKEHEELANVWKKGAIGGLFMLLGTLITWAGSILWSHK